MMPTDSAETTDARTMQIQQASACLDQAAAHERDMARYEIGSYEWRLAAARRDTCMTAALQWEQDANAN
jgi:hypothetical protein